MKKLPAFLNTPTRVVVTVGLIVLTVEFLIMLLIEIIHTATLKIGFLGEVSWKLVDPILLAVFVAPALYFLIFRTLNQQAELERQLDELSRFQKLTVGRELRMKELVAEIAALRIPFSAEPAGDIPVTIDSLEAEAPHHAAAYTQRAEESQRNALLFMLDDLENARKKIAQSHHEWIAALDAESDLIFLHDKQFRILRCNKAYQQSAGIPFERIIGQPYYEVFPKTHAPLPCCLQATEKVDEVDEVAVGETIFRTRAFAIHDEQGVYLYSVHTLEDITKNKQAEAKITSQLKELRRWHEATLEIGMRNIELKREINELLKQAGQPPRYPGAEPGEGRPPIV